MNLLLLTILLVLGNSHSHKKELVINCDLVEVNNCFELKPDLTLNYTYTQYIFYDWCPQYRRYNVIYWRLAEDVDYFKINNNRHKMKCYDTDAKKHLIIYSKLYRESSTNTDSDPERLNRKLHDEKFRPVFKDKE